MTEALPLQVQRVLYPFPEPLPMPKARAIQVVKTVASLAARGVEVDFAYVPSGDDPFSHYDVAPHPGIRRLPLSRGLPWPFCGVPLHSGKLFARRLLNELRRMRASGRCFDAILVRHLKLAHVLLDVAPDIPLIYEAHEVFADEAPPERAEKLALIERDVVHRASVVISISRGLAESLMSRYGVDRELVVIPSATDMPPIAPAKDWANARRHIVYTGSLYPWKGAQDLAEAAAQLCDCNITIVGGDTAQIAALRLHVAGTGEGLHFRGRVSHSDALSELGRTCIAVLPNRAGSVSAYTSPLKLFEYMAYGCAIVAADLPVFREILGPDDAAWFMPGDPSSLAQAIRSLAVDPERARRMGERLRVRAEDYTWNKRAEHLIRAMSLAGTS